MVVQHHFKVSCIHCVANILKGIGTVSEIVRSDFCITGSHKFEQMFLVLERLACLQGQLLRKFDSLSKGELVKDPDHCLLVTDHLSVNAIVFSACEKSTACALALMQFIQLLSPVCLCKNSSRLCPSMPSNSKIP